MLDLYDLTRDELRLLFVRWGLNPAHAARLWYYLYLECAESFDAMPRLPARIRTRLAAEAAPGILPVARETNSADGFTRKFLLGLHPATQAEDPIEGPALSDVEGPALSKVEGPALSEVEGPLIETVLMRFTGRVTACVSSQAGCAMGCVFCATGQSGFQRHLTTGEIVAQAVHVQRILRRAGGPAAPRLRNVVLMGMGEPLHNYDAVMKAADIFRDPSGLALGADRITLSTVGIVPGILRLAAERHRPVHLAVSLHAANQEERAALVPVARKWPLDQLMAACRAYIEQTGRRIFYEWTLIEGKNDSPAHARAVGRLLRGQVAQVNLIPLNPTAGFDGAPPRSETARQFQKILADEFALPSTIRQRRGIDIAAGCGQLAGASS